MIPNRRFGHSHVFAERTLAEILATEANILSQRRFDRFRTVTVGQRFSDRRQTGQFPQLQPPGESTLNERTRNARGPAKLVQRHPLSLLTGHLPQDLDNFFRRIARLAPTSRNPRQPGFFPQVGPASELFTNHPIRNTGPAAKLEKGHILAALHRHPLERLDDALPDLVEQLHVNTAEQNRRILIHHDCCRRIHALSHTVCSPNTDVVARGCHRPRGGVRAKRWL